MKIKTTCRCMVCGHEQTFTAEGGRVGVWTLICDKCDRPQRHRCNAGPSHVVQFHGIIDNLKEVNKQLQASNEEIRDSVLPK